jgi:hypothetical protein
VSSRFGVVEEVPRLHDQIYVLDEKIGCYHDHLEDEAEIKTGFASGFVLEFERGRVEVEDLRRRLEKFPL